MGDTGGECGWVDVAAARRVGGNGGLADDEFVNVDTIRADLKDRRAWVLATRSRQQARAVCVLGSALCNAGSVTDFPKRSVVLTVVELNVIPTRSSQYVLRKLERNLPVDQVTDSSVNSQVSTSSVALLEPWADRRVRDDVVGGGKLCAQLRRE